MDKGTLNGLKANIEQIESATNNVLGFVCDHVMDALGEDETYGKSIKMTYTNEVADKPAIKRLFINDNGDVMFADSELAEYNLLRGDVTPNEAMALADDLINGYYTIG